MFHSTRLDVERVVRIVGRKVLNLGHVEKFLDGLEVHHVVRLHMRVVHRIHVVIGIDLRCGRLGFTTRHTRGSCIRRVHALG